MSGHSKWANIKHKKERTDSQRGKIFTKIGREIAIAVRESGADPDTNGKLRDIIAKAKANNMPNDNIARSVKKAAGDGEGISYEEILYEGYAPGGVAMIVEVLTDNRNRAAAEIRHIFDKNGGALGNSGCVGWMFDRRGVIVVEKTAKTDSDALMMAALEAGASDIQELDDAFEIYTDVADFSVVREAIEKEGYTFLSAELSRLPQNTVASPDEDTVASILKIIDMLEDNDDVQMVFHNAELPEEEDEE